MMDIKEVLQTMIYTFFDKRSALLPLSEVLPMQHTFASGNGIKNENMSNQELAKEWHKSIIFKISKLKSTFILYRQVFGVLI